MFLLNDVLPQNTRIISYVSCQTLIGVSGFGKNPLDKIIFNKISFADLY